MATSYFEIHFKKLNPSVVLQTHRSRILEMEAALSEPLKAVSGPPASYPYIVTYFEINMSLQYLSW